jgi:pantothenate kinase
LNPDALAADIAARAAGRARFFVAIAGAPAAGKSTFAETLLAAVGRVAPEEAALLPMDGYHFDDAVLDELGFRSRKGAAHTFDVDALERDLGRIRACDRDVAVPVFDRSLELARAAARLIRPRHRIVLVEGNYLLLDAPPWDRLAGAFDRTVFLAVPVPELRRRLLARWDGYGREPAAAAAWVESNDLPNALLIAERSRPADVVIENT